MRKCDYRYRFQQFRKYVKFSVICKEVGISQPSFSMFMKGYDWNLSLEKLQAIDNRLHDLTKLMV